MITERERQSLKALVNDLELQLAMAADALNTMIREIGGIDTCQCRNPCTGGNLRKAIIDMSYRVFEKLAHGGVIRNAMTEGASADAEASECDADILELLVAADSELSAIAHGRPPSDKRELLEISSGLRKAWEAMKRSRQR